jgi:hypothetical protein
MTSLQIREHDFFSLVRPKYVKEKMLVLFVFWIPCFDPSSYIEDEGDNLEYIYINKDGNPSTKCTRHV